MPKVEIVEKDGRKVIRIIGLQFGKPIPRKCIEMYMRGESGEC